MPPHRWSSAHRPPATLRASSTVASPALPGDIFPAAALSGDGALLGEDLTCVGADSAASLMTLRSVPDECSPSISKATVAVESARFSPLSSTFLTVPCRQTALSKRMSAGHHC